MHSPMNQFYFCKIISKHILKTKDLKLDSFWVEMLYFHIEKWRISGKNTVIYNLKPFIMYFSSNNCLVTCLSIYADTVNSKIEIHHWICLYFVYFAVGEKPFFFHWSMIFTLGIAIKRSFFVWSIQIFLDCLV